jgi:short subunit dehydrogenase-like uncharacterized protein
MEQCEGIVMARKRILLYGATGYSGRLIAEEAARKSADRDNPWDFDLVLASRDRRRLAEMGECLKLGWTAFSLDDERRVADAIQGFDVLINAAGPFSETAMRLAKSAIRARCHYVDLNGEVDVYQHLLELQYVAKQTDVALVSGAGHTAALSDLMLRAALRKMRDDKKLGEIGAVRIAVEQMKFLSRGSARTMMRMVREEVTVARAVPNEKDRLALTHVPVGSLERTFNFGGGCPRDCDQQKDCVCDPRQRARPRIASAANLIDTLTARVCLEGEPVGVQSIESYIEMPGSMRLGYQLGSFAAFSFQIPVLRELNRWQVDMLPDGPDKEERMKNSHRVVLQIDDVYREPLIDWCLLTGDPYELTARIALGVAEDPARKGNGWQTPAAALKPLGFMLRDKQRSAVLTGCQWLRHS